MDIDVARRKEGVPSSVCCHCRKPGHWTCSCSEGLDVCYLSADKQDALIIELLAAKDAVGVPSPEAAGVSSLEAADKVSEAKEENMSEDF